MRKIIPLFLVAFFVAVSSASAAGPSVTIERTDPAPEVVFYTDDFSSWRISFSEDVVGFTEDDIIWDQRPSGTWDMDLTGSGAFWYLDLWRSEGDGDGALQFSVAEEGVENTSGEKGPTNSDRSSSLIQIDGSAPSEGGFALGPLAAEIPGTSWRPSRPLLGGDWVASDVSGDKALAIASNGSLALDNGSLVRPSGLDGSGWKNVAAGSSWMAIRANGQTAFSDDALAWSPGASLDSTEEWQDIEYFGGAFWALSRNGVVQKLQAGSWISAGDFVGSDWKRLDARGSRLLALHSSAAATRFRGSWSQVSMPAGNWEHLASSPSLSIAATEAGDVALSRNGATWETPASSLSGVSDLIFWRGSFYVIAGEKVAISRDGVSWVESAMPIGSAWQKLLGARRTLRALAPTASTSSYNLSSAGGSVSQIGFTDNDPALSESVVRQTSIIEDGVCADQWSSPVDATLSWTPQSDRCYLYTQEGSDRTGNSSLWQRAWSTASAPTVSEFVRISPIATQESVSVTTLRYRVVFSEALRTSTFTPGDILLEGAAAPSWTVSEVSNPSGNGTHWLVELAGSNLLPGELRVGIKEVSLQDSSGNSGPETAAWSTTATTVDADPPSPPSWSTVPPTLVNSSSLQVQFVPSEAGGSVQCALDNLPEETCSSPWTWSGLSHGSHRIRLWQIDAAGNRSSLPLEHSFTVDLVAPSAPAILAGPLQGSFVSSTSASFVWSGESGASFLCSLDGATASSCSSPWNTEGLSQGAHTFSVRARDEAGNLSAATSRSWTVDTVSPSAPTWSSAPTNPTGSAEASFHWIGENWASFECKRENSDWEGCTSPRSFSGLASGNYTFQVRQTDRAGNRGPAVSWNWEVIRGQPPQPIWTQTPPAASSSASARFEFSSSSDDQFQCSLDSAEWQSCSSPWEVDELNDGAHSLRVRQVNAVDVAGTPASWTWTVDTVAPLPAEIRGQPLAWTSASTASFSWSGEIAATSFCSLNNAEWQSCSSIYELQNLSEGPQTFRIRLRDAAGNFSEPVSYSWNVDKTPPAAPQILEAPPTSTPSLEQRFVWQSEEGAQSQCSLDGAPWDVCRSPLTLSFVSAGRHTLLIRQKDRAGNISSNTTFSWSIDVSAPPAPEIIDFPGIWSRDKVVSFSWISGDTRSQCRIGDSSWQICRSPYEWTPPSDGKYVFQVRSLNQAGTASEVRSRSWNTDRTAPTLTRVQLRALRGDKYSLSLQAKDIGGILRIAFRSPAQDLRIAKQIRLQGNPRQARVSDRAGNWSRWVRIKK